MIKNLSREEIVEILKIQRNDIVKFDDNCQSILFSWSLIKIVPELWVNSQYPHEPFWVVGLFGNKAIWFNDIEGSACGDGMNISTWKYHGILEEYGCEIYSLFATLNRLKMGEHPSATISS